MNTKRFFFVMAGLTTLLPILIVATAVAGNKLLTNKATQLSDLRAESQVVDSQKIALIQGKKNIEKYSDLDEIARAVVPQDKDQARSIREINAIAAETGINLQTVTFDASSLGQAPPATKPADDGTGEKPAAPDQPQTSISQVKPVEGIPGVYSLQLSISPAADQAIPYERFLSFLEKLEKNRRTAHVDKISVTPVGSGVTFTLAINVYLKP